MFFTALSTINKTVNNPKSYDLPVEQLVVFGSVIIFLSLTVLALKKIGMLKNVFISLLRMIIQLSLVGIYLKFIFKWDNPCINIAYVTLMAFIAGTAINKHTAIKYKTYTVNLFLIIATPVISVLLTMSLLLINLNHLIKAEYLIPVTGMLLGNTISAIIYSINSFVSSIKDNYESYLYRLALSADMNTALKNYSNDAAKAALKPIMASMATVGLVTLPGMMTGQILGGASPIVAIKYQIMIMISIFATQFFSILLAMFLLKKSIFDKFGNLRCNFFKD